MFRRIVQMAAVVLVTMLLAPSGASAQEEEGGGEFGPCGKGIETTGWGTNQHKNESGANVRYYSHDHCVRCFSSMGGDEACHAPCSNGLSPEAAIAYLAAHKAAAKGDAAQVISLGRKSGGLVVFNAQRGAVQVLNCSGDKVIASLTLTKELQRVAMRLPDSKSSMAECRLSRCRKEQRLLVRSIAVDGD